ncbi:hypothetical protein EF888_18370 [Silicimonas algicola]|uniref:Uncharacterized protein n=1 Tax=Silicimonas algicola TaxID=1826607 RepID=A0A316G5S6_9RHOB|nr:hypothetical protein [Silicimonas algicola]AZQ68918.1 hypothetical protein EF888_18370 [Silicimonas algicola]PWK55983.1 hypothetical protein C8D95_10545 [Silicimonas algicola]
MDEDVQALKKRLETKIRENASDLKEFTRERTDQAMLELRSEIGRVDMRISGLERLLWNRFATFLAGAVFGVAVSAIGLLAIKAL